MLALARAVLRPELVNRVDEVVLFAALAPGGAGRRSPAWRWPRRGGGWRAQGIGLVVSDAAVAWLAGRGDRGAGAGGTAAAPDGGAEVDRQLSRMLLAGQVAAGRRGARRRRRALAAALLVFTVHGRAGGDDRP